MKAKHTTTQSSKTTQFLNNQHFDISHFQINQEIGGTISPEEAKESKDIQQAKELLGDQYTTEEIKEVITLFEYLIQNWTEEYEKIIFEGKTLKEIIQTV